MQKIAIIMTYFNRKQQLLRTLDTIEESKHTDYHVFIVDDGSEEPLELSRRCKLTIVRVQPDRRVGPYTVPFNIGIGRALMERPDIIIIQNAECYHMGDVLMYADAHVSDIRCVSFACWNEAGRNPDVMKAIAEDTNYTHGCPWYNHPVNARLFHFCNAYSRLAMIALNGMDERFMHGIGHDDNDLVQRMGALGLSSHITDETLPFVVHQAHSRKGQHNPEGRQRNQALFYRLKTEEPWRYRAKHLVTPDFNSRSLP